MAKKFFTDESLATFVDEVKSYTDSSVASKQDKNLIVQYQPQSTTMATHGVDEIAAAADAGVEVKFFDGYEYLNLLEYSESQGFAVFYVDYFDMEEKLTVKYIVLSSNGGIMMSDTYTRNVAYKTDLNAKQNTITGTEGQVVQIDASGKAVAADLNLITVDEIDAICGGAIEYAEDVMF